MRQPRAYIIMKLIIFLYAAVMSLITFVVFGIDKYKAITNRWRIRERTLFLLAILGGGAGAFLGMQVFHHKTLHKQFAIGIPLIMAVQVLLLWFLWVKL